MDLCKTNLVETSKHILEKMLTAQVESICQTHDYFLRGEGGELLAEMLKLAVDNKHVEAGCSKSQTGDEL